MRIVRWGQVLQVVLAAVVIIGAAQLAEAQSAVYGIAGPAGVKGFFRGGRALHAAGGADVLIAGPVGVSGEFGAFANISSVLWVMSANGTVALSAAPSTARVVPFVTGGYTRLNSGDGSFNAWNIGGGVNAWLGGRVGFRADVRDHVRPDFRGTVQYWTVRGGVVIRVG